MRKMVVGNWKMNGSLALVDEFVAGLDESVILGLPSIFVAYVHLKNPALQIAAQDCSIFNNFGAHTGEISARMLADAGCRYVIVGHSERRKTSNFDTVQNVLVKLQNVIECGMTAILCVDEHYPELIDETTDDLLKRHTNKVVIAYEPLSAIGTGAVPTQNDIYNVLKDIKAHLPGAKVLYGGSVNAENCYQILSIPSCDGVLIGSSSLKLTALNAVAGIMDATS